MSLSLIFCRAKAPRPLTVEAPILTSSPRLAEALFVRKMPIAIPAVMPITSTTGMVRNVLASIGFLLLERECMPELKLLERC